MLTIQRRNRLIFAEIFSEKAFCDLALALGLGFLGVIALPLFRLGYPYLQLIYNKKQ